MLSRRQVAAGLGSSLGLSVPNIGAGQTPPPVPQDPDAAHVDTGFDPGLRMTAPVRVDGRGPYRFVVDTGANRSVVAAEIAQELGMPGRGQVGLHGIAGVLMVDTVQVEAFEVGRVVSRGLRMPVLPRRDLGADGLIGLDALRGRAVEMDFNNRVLRIDRGGALDRPSASWVQSTVPVAMRPRVTVPARFREGQLTLVDAEAGGTKVVAFIDSGAQTTVANLALRDAVGPDVLEYPAGDEPVEVLGAAGQVVTGKLARLRGLRFGGVQAKGVPVVLADLHTFRLWGLSDQPALMLGANTLRAFQTVTLDFRRRSVTLQF